MIRISQLPWRLLTLLVMTLAVAACAGFDPGELIPPLSVGTPTAPAEPTPTATVAPSIDETPVLMCTPPACAPGEVYVCPGGDCPGGCGTICAAPDCRGRRRAAARR